jgi:hypothetical protein
LFPAGQHLNSGTNLRDCEDQSWFKVRAVSVFLFIGVRRFRLPLGVRVSQLEVHWLKTAILMHFIYFSRTLKKRVFRHLLTLERIGLSAVNKLYFTMEKH